MKKINLKDLKQYLNQKSKEKLINEISDLFGMFENVKDYYTTKINPDNEEQVLQKFKDKIKKEFFPSRGFGKARLSVARKAISDFKKVTNSKKGLDTPMLFYRYYLNIRYFSFNCYKLIRIFCLPLLFYGWT
ncbi:MAG: DUF6155 family protein [Thermodesulfobacteriota bacterium]|nr:DUF6155 family protein [Thermodesulfobacteriota bacterium]